MLKLIILIVIHNRINLPFLLVFTATSSDGVAYSTRLEHSQALFSLASGSKDFEIMLEGKKKKKKKKGKELRRQNGRDVHS